MMPAIATRPPTEPVRGQQRQAAEPEGGSAGFGALLDLPRRDLQPVDAAAADLPRLPGHTWSMPFDLLGGEVSTDADADATGKPDDQSLDADTDHGEELSDLVLPSALIVQMAPPAQAPALKLAVEAAAENVAAQQAEEATRTADTAGDAKASASVSTDPSTETARTNSAAAQASAAAAQPPAVRTADRKQGATKANETDQATPGRRPEVLSATQTSQATPAVAVRSDAVVAWDANRADQVEAAKGDETSPPSGQTAPTATPPTLSTTVPTPGVAPTQLALDPVEQPAFVQAARNVTAAEVEHRGTSATERLTLQLKPVDLGAVTAVLHSANGTLSVELHVENIEAHHRLSNEKEAIGKALRDLGLDVGVITVQQAVLPAQAIDRDQATNLSNGNGSRHENASWSAGEGRGNDGSPNRGAGSNGNPGSAGSAPRGVETGRERASSGRYI